MRRAQLIAEAVAVLCPACGEPQPNLEGSEMWTHEDFKRWHDKRSKERLIKNRSGLFTCVSCDAVMILGSDSKVMFQ